MKILKVMVLKRFKNIVKDDEDEEKKKEQRNLRDEPESVMDRRNEREVDRNPRENSSMTESSRGKERSDLGIPSERNLGDLPDLKERSSSQRTSDRRSTGTGERRSTRGTRPRTQGPTRTPGRDTRNRSNENTENIQRTLQRILDKLDQIDRRLQRFERG